MPLIPDYISDDLKKLVRFEGTTCLGFCNKEDGTKPPFVEVNGKSISEANYASVIEIIKNEIKDK